MCCLDESHADHIKADFKLPGTLFLTSPRVSHSSNGLSAFFSGLQLRGVLWFKAAANHFLFFEEWIFSQFGHSFLKVCFVCEPERLCALRVNPETGCRSVCKGAITVRHCCSASHTFERVPYAHAAHHDHRCIVHGSSPCNQRDGETE